MVGDMENIKVKFNNISERDEILGLLDNLGYNLVNNIACEKRFVVASLCSSGITFDYWDDVKEITLQYLRDLVVLKRNDVNDAKYVDSHLFKVYIDSDDKIYYFERRQFNNGQYNT